MKKEAIQKRIQELEQESHHYSKIHDTHIEAHEQCCLLEGYIENVREQFHEETKSLKKQIKEKQLTQKQLELLKRQIEVLNNIVKSFEVAINMFSTFSRINYLEAPTYSSLAHQIDDKIIKMKHILKTKQESQ